MNRRAFMKLLGAGGVVVLLPPSLEGCGDRSLEALQGWKGPVGLPEGSDIRLHLVSYAILAPSAHNKQPWLVDLRGEGIDLYVDPERLLPHTDPPARQIMISQGTFLETLAVAASHYGYRTDITLFPEGVDLLERIGENPVARVALHKTEEAREDDLFPHIVHRHTNRRVYSGPPLTESELSALRQSYADENYPLRLFTDPTEISQTAEMMTEAMRIETYTRAMHGETVEMLRFTDEEVEQYRDGISFPNLGITGIKLFFARMFAGRSKAFEESFLERTVESVREGAFSSQAIGLISSRGTTRMDEVLVGRAFARLFLTATTLGLSLHPMSQIMEIDSVKKQFLEAMAIRDEEPQMLFRLGRSTPTPHSPRRDVNDLLRVSEESNAGNK